MCNCVSVVRKGHTRCNDDLGKCSKNAEIKSTPLLNLKPISPAIYRCMRLCAMTFCVRMRLAPGSVRACRIAALPSRQVSVIIMLEPQQTWVHMSCHRAADNRSQTTGKFGVKPHLAMDYQLQRGEINRNTVCQAVGPQNSFVRKLLFTLAPGPLNHFSGPSIVQNELEWFESLAVQSPCSSFIFWTLQRL